jgi:hypothetical protein
MVELFRQRSGAVAGGSRGRAWRPVGGGGRRGGRRAWGWAPARHGLPAAGSVGSHAAARPGPTRPWRPQHGGAGPHAWRLGAAGAAARMDPRPGAMVAGVAARCEPAARHGPGLGPRRAATASRGQAARSSGSAGAGPGGGGVDSRQRPGRMAVAVTWTPRRAAVASLDGRHNFFYFFNRLLGAGDWVNRP